MTEKDKNRILDLRNKGLGYKAIASMLNVSRDTVRKYCKQCGLAGYAEAVKMNIQDGINSGEICQNCGQKINSAAHGRKKKFCSDKCRSTWWSKNFELHNFKKDKVFKVVCAECGREFISYSNKSRKYCSHSCYIKHRFGGKEDD